MGNSENGNELPELIREVLPGIMEKLIREFPAYEGDIGRIMQIPNGEIIRRMKEELEEEFTGRADRKESGNK